MSTCQTTWRHGDQGTRYGAASCIVHESSMHPTCIMLLHEPTIEPTITRNLPLLQAITYRSHMFIGLVQTPHIARILVVLDNVLVVAPSRYEEGASASSCRASRKGEHGVDCRSAASCEEQRRRRHRWIESAVARRRVPGADVADEKRHWRSGFFLLEAAARRLVAGCRLGGSNDHRTPLTRASLCEARREKSRWR